MGAANYAQMFTGLGNAGGAIYGAIQANKQDQINPGKFYYTGYDPTADALIAALTMDALLGLGQGDGSIALQASPIDQVRNAALKSGQFNHDDLNRLSLVLNDIQNGGTGAGIGGKNTGKYQAVLRRALGAAGMGSVQDLLKAEADYKAKVAKDEALYGPVRQQVQAGRLAALQGIAKIAQDYPTASAGDIDALQQTVAKEIEAETDRYEGQARDQALQAAAVGRYNPAGELSKLSERYALDRSKIGTSSLDRALQLLSGRETVANQAIAGLYGAINPAFANAGNAASLRSGAQLSASQLAAQQLAAMNQAQLSEWLSMGQRRDQYVQEAMNQFQYAAGGAGGLGVGGGGGSIGGGGGYQVPSYVGGPGSGSSLTDLYFGMGYGS